MGLADCQRTAARTDFKLLVIVAVFPLVEDCADAVGEILIGEDSNLVHAARQTALVDFGIFGVCLVGIAAHVLNDHWDILVIIVPPIVVGLHDAESLIGIADSLCAFHCLVLSCCLLLKCPIGLDGE